MADLSSCYFCGAAMDVSLRESTIVPEALAPTPAHQTTVVLCGTCERKLERVLDPVVAAANASRTAETAATGGPTAAGDTTTAGEGDAVDGTTSADADATVPPSILSDVADDGTSTTGDDDATADDTAGNESAADDGTPFEVDDTTSVFDDADDTASSSVFADANDTATTPIQDAESDDDTDGIAFDDQSGGENTATNRESTPNAANASNANTGGPSTDDASTSSSDPDTPDVDPQTYNKVVRLLKNRDLPVPRAEIESIAGSAYDIPDHECEAIIDAAIQRGLVAEADDQLTHPDGV